MAGDVVEIQINLTGDAQEKATSLKGSLGGLGSFLGGALKVGLGVAVAGFGAVATGIGLAISEAMGAQEVMAQLEAVLTSTGGAAGVTVDMATDLADSLSQVTRFSDDAILSGENMLLTFTNIGADVFPEATQAILDMATATGGDLKGAAVQLGKALNDPIAGISALSKVGVTFTDEQKKVIQSMVDAGDVAGAQGLILAELQKEFGGSAEAAGQTFAGQLDILKNSLLNVAEGVGMQLLPLLQTLTGFVTENLLPWVQNLGTEFGALMSVVNNLGFEALFTTMSDGTSVFSGFLESLGFGQETAISLSSAIGDLSIWLGTNLPLAFQAVSDFWTGTLYPALQELWNWLAVNVPLAIQTVSTFWTETLLPAITGVWSWLVTNLIPIFVELYTWAQANLPSALQQLSDFWTGTLQPAITQVWAWVTGTLFPALQTLWDWLAPKLTAALIGLGNFWVNTLLPAILSVWTWVIGTLFPMLTELWTWLSTTLTAALQTLSDFWTGTLQPALEIVWGFVEESLFPLFEKVSELFGVTLLAAVTTLSEYWSGTLYPALEDIWDLVKTYLQPVLDNLSAFFEETIVPAITGVLPTLEELGGFFSELKTTVSGLISFITTLINKIKGIPPIPGTGGGSSGNPDTPEEKAVGGSVTGGNPYIVGERGPELFVPGRSGTIVTNEDLMSVLQSLIPSGGQTVNQFVLVIQAARADEQSVIAGFDTLQQLARM